MAIGVNRLYLCVVEISAGQNVWPLIFLRDQPRSNRIVNDVIIFRGHTLVVPVIEEISLPSYTGDSCGDAFVIPNQL